VGSLIKALSIPLFKTIRQWSDRKKNFDTVFHITVTQKSSLKKMHKVLNTKGVVKFSRSRNTQDVVPQSQIELIENILSHSADM
jgi:hypothetical protein